MKCYRTLFIIFVVLCLFAFTSTSALASNGLNTTKNKSNIITSMGAGEWDKILVDTIIGNDRSSGYADSHGGDFKIEFEDPGLHGIIAVQLMEKDYWNSDDKVRSPRTVNSQGGSIIYRNIDAYLDGGEAEFYIKIHFNPDNLNGIKAIFYD